ncbi:unnamed protein product [Schistosoma margrebowiei]|uniref:Uncharacterized protein n=1 Tax=Schistosoma margrebowiei TaxID=48269 RepID=A0A183M6X4_9TREM|nr:unnamed protein product [Schistosoma margrebowiei]
MRFIFCTHTGWQRYIIKNSIQTNQRRESCSL